MLEPEYFNDKADKMLEIYRQLEDFILQDIAGRLLESGAVSGTADRMLWKLEQMGANRAAVLNKLTALTKLSRRELKELLQDAVLTSWDDDLSTFNELGISVLNPLENELVMSVMNAEYRKSLGELQNLTRTTADQTARDLMRMLDEAEIRVASGVQSYSQAVCSILDNYAKKGVTIDYPTGTQRTLESAVRMCVVTSMNQTSAQITNQYIVEGEVKYVLVSAHLGARTQPQGQSYLAGHENWQGKVYRIRGSEPGYPNLAEMTGYDIDENGDGKVINPLGLHGYNCRHSHKPWDKDLRNPYVDENGNPIIDSEESRKLYENQQKQRAMERSIRKTKRELLIKQKQIESVAETDIKDILQKDYDKLADTLRRKNKAYNQFCEENELQTQQDRLKVAGFKRAQAAKANGRARAYEHWKKSIVAGKNESRARKEAAEKIFYVEPKERTNVVLAENIYKDLKRSEIGRATIKFFEENNVNVEIINNMLTVNELGMEFDYGIQFGRHIYINAINCGTTKKIVDTIIHEKTHMDYPEMRGQYIECVCDIMAFKHRNNKLTGEDIRTIIKSVKERYPEYKWRE